MSLAAPFLLLQASEEAVMSQVSFHHSMIKYFNVTLPRHSVFTLHAHYEYRGEQESL